MQVREVSGYSPARRFWIKWIGSRFDGKYEMCRKLAKYIAACCELRKEENGEELMIHCIASFLQSYLEDLLETIAFENVEIK